MRGSPSPTAAPCGWDLQILFNASLVLAFHVDLQETSCSSPLQIFRRVALAISPRLFALVCAEMRDKLLKAQNVLGFAVHELENIVELLICKVGRM